MEARPTIVLSTSIDPASVTSALRKAVSEVDANVPLDQIETMQQIVSGSVGQSRFRAACSLCSRFWPSLSLPSVCMES